MGADGGSIPTRTELVKGPRAGPTKSEKSDSRAAKQEYNWSTDPAAQKPLHTPVVSDALGRLYNKETILEYLISGSTGTPEQDARLKGLVKSLKDVVEVRFHVASGGARGLDGLRAEKWVCPLNENKELGPENKSVYLVPCGHAFAESELKNITARNCPTCNDEFELEHKITILPGEDGDEERLVERVQRLRERNLTHSLKKGGKEKKKRKLDESAKDVTAHVEEGEVKPAKLGPATSSSFNNSAIAAVAAKVRADQDERFKRLKTTPNDNLKELFTKTGSSGKTTGRNNDFMTRGYAVNR